MSIYIELLIISMTLDPENSVVYVAFTKPFLDSKIKEWEENKANATNHLYQLIGF